MSPNTCTQLLIVGIILGSYLFFNNYQSSHAQEFKVKTDNAIDEALDIIIPLPTTSGQEHGREQELTSPQQQTTRDVIEENSNQEAASELGKVSQREMTRQQNEEEEKEIEILEQEEEDDSSTASNPIQEEKQEERNNDQDNNDVEEGKQDVNDDVPLELPFP
jgi:hypothetical protein